MTALVGPSGCGKTTLFEVPLSSRQCKKTKTVSLFPSVLLN
ncbi:hypothetical protein P7H16_07155 [Paenibacillus larvae]|nr:hypothetical protein [Paenibacillus larvae]MDT2246770.1 hypothetical protein [Paenibacillus larvae]